MITEQQAMELLIEANPVPDLSALDLSGDLPATPLAESQSRSSDMTELKSRHVDRRSAPGWRRLMLGTAAAAVLIVIVAVVLFQVTAGDPVAAPAPSATPTTVSRGDPPEVDYTIDLNTGEMTPLPDSILASLGPERPSNTPSPGQYVTSPDSSRLAYVGTADDGSLQIFIAGINGTGVRQLSDHPTDAIYPAWSPDGAKIAYQGESGLFVIDVATGASTQVTDAPSGAAAPQFTPDGLSLLYTFPSTGDDHQLWIVPIIGGSSTVLVGREQGMGAAGFGSLSPDGSLVTMMGHKIDGPGAVRFLAATDGSEPRAMRQLHSGNCRSIPAGAWSPDGSRIVCSGDSRNVLVVDVATGRITSPAEGAAAAWLDNHTLLVET
ncbi:MAG: DPP IV N-terminal domain-containing protein [Actinomycetota bacterium]